MGLDQSSGIERDGILQFRIIEQPGHGIGERSRIVLLGHQTRLHGVNDFGNAGYGSRHAGCTSRHGFEQYRRQPVSIAIAAYDTRGSMDG